MSRAASSAKTTRVRPDLLPGVLPIYSVTPFTMLDFPQRTACIIWFSGCNMRCPYCHNPQIVKGRGRGDTRQVMDFLKRRQGLLDGVVLSGGEASAYPGLPDFIRDVKALGYAIKLDTNGLRPDTISNFLSQGFLDYIALDYKAPPAKFKSVTGTDKFQLFSETLDILCSQSHVSFEIRTTIHTGLMDENDIMKIMIDLDKRHYTGLYVIQNFVHSDGRPTLGSMPPQKRILETSAIKPAESFDLEFRNFPA
ncbi:MAG: anaerobic ribonucleoside-triphosphate reductase activating protein [Alphaproteobacteria bacterium]|nr:anaerobic ribonucleoside-triphosphate reductase activating protein [Alphaproteobacteria bacterium]